MKKEKNKNQSAFILSSFFLFDWRRKRLNFLSQEEESDSKEGKKKWIQGIELFLDMERNIWAQNCRSLSQNPLRKRTLGTKTSLLTTKRRLEMVRTISLPSLCHLLRGRKRLCLAAQVVAGNPRMPSWGFVVMCYLYMFVLFDYVVVYVV